MVIRGTNANQTRCQIREVFRNAEKYGLEISMDDVLAERIRGIRYQKSGITGDLFRLWDRSSLREKELIEQTFEILSGRSFEAFVADVHTDISGKSEEKLCKKLPPHPFPMPAPGYADRMRREYAVRLRG